MKRGNRRKKKKKMRKGELQRGMSELVAGKVVFYVLSKRGAIPSGVGRYGRACFQNANETTGERKVSNVVFFAQQWGKLLPSGVCGYVCFLLSNVKWSALALQSP